MKNLSELCSASVRGGNVNEAADEKMCVNLFECVRCPLLLFVDINNSSIHDSL